MKRWKEEILRMSGVDPRKCMKCGKCSASCPAYGSMTYHPHQFVAMVERGEIEPLMDDASVYRCLTCYACVERCPRGVEPAKLIEAVRLLAVRRQGGNHLKADDVPARLDGEMPQQAIVTAFRKYSK